MIVFRVDANDIIGRGQLLRCIAVAQQLQAFDEAVTFVSADEKCGDCLAAEGFTHIVLHTNWTRLEKETDVFASLLNIIKPKCLLVDSSFTTPEYLNRLRGITRLICFDELGETVNFADAVINPIAFEDGAGYSMIYAGAQTQCLLGLRYAPVREQFIGAVQKPIDDAVSDILLFGDTAAELQACARLASEMAQDAFFNGVRLHIAAPPTDEITSLLNEFPNVALCGSDIAPGSIAASCDIAAAADCTAIFELLACGIPTVLFGIEGEEKITRRLLDGIGAAADSGLLGQREDEHAAVNAVKALFDREKRIRLRSGALSAIDGRGAARIAAFLTGGQV